jgi:hypothetical protein
MSEHVYKVVELVGSSSSSIEDAIQTVRWLGLSEQRFRLAKWSLC